MMEATISCSTDRPRVPPLPPLWAESRNDGEGSGKGSLPSPSTHCASGHRPLDLPREGSNKRASMEGQDNPHAPCSEVTASFPTTMKSLLVGGESVDLQAQGANHSMEPLTPSPHSQTPALPRSPVQVIGQSHGHQRGTNPREEAGRVAGQHLHSLCPVFRELARGRAVAASVTLAGG